MLTIVLADNLVHEIHSSSPLSQQVEIRDYDWAETGDVSILPDGHELIEGDEGTYVRSIKTVGANTDLAQIPDLMKALADVDQVRRETQRTQRTLAQLGLGKLIRAQCTDAVEARLKVSDTYSGSRFFSLSEVKLADGSYVSDLQFVDIEESEVDGYSFNELVGWLEQSYSSDELFEGDEVLIDLTA